jgi:hypothetical protein
MFKALRALNLDADTLRVLAQTPAEHLAESFHFLADPIPFLEAHCRVDFPEMLPEHIQRLWWLKKAEADPAGYMRIRLEVAARFFEQTERAADNNAHGHDSLRITRVLNSGEDLPDQVIPRALRESTRQWMLVNGTLHEGLLRAPLPSGLFALYDPQQDPLYTRVRTEDSPDHVHVVLRQWVEVPPDSEDDTYKFARVLEANPRWLRTIAILQQSDPPPNAESVAAALRGDGLPFTPSVVQYALWRLGRADKCPPLRGGMVTTFLVAIAFDPNNPSEKKPYGPLRIEIRPELDWTHQHLLTTTLQAMREQQAQREYHYEVCQPDIISANWTPGRSFEDLAGKTAVEHQRWLTDTVGMSQSFLREGELLQGRSRKHDGIRDLIEAGIGAGQSDDEIVAAVLAQEQRETRRTFGVDLGSSEQNALKDKVRKGSISTGCIGSST